MAHVLESDPATSSFGRLWSLRIRAVTLLEDWPAALVSLAARLWMASIFFRAGLLKIQDMSSTEFLFTDIHPVPFLAPVVSAYLATAVELACSALVAVGLLTRLAALPMLAMTLVIQFIVGWNDPSFYMDEHFYWMMLLGFIVTRGPGRLSLDHLIAARASGHG